MGTQQFCLKWNNHHSNMLSVFEQLLSDEALVDVTLACEGHSLKAHKVVLSACSPFFQTLFVDNPCKHPIVIMKDMRYVDMKAIINFIYHGEVNVSQDQLSALLKTAETLKVKGLAEVGSEKQAEKQGDQQDVTTPSNSVQSVPVTGIQQHRGTESPPLHKRKRGRPRRRSGSSQSDTEEPVPTKIKEPDSPEIISDISRDGLTESTPDVTQRISQPRVPPITSSQSYSLSSQKSHSLYSSVPSHHDSSAAVEEPPSITDGDFDVEPTRLMEASLSTDASGVSVYDSQVQSSLTSTSTSLALPSSSVELPHSNSLSQAVPTSLHSASDSSGSGLGNQNTLEDIKPLVSFEEPPIGVSSHSQDSSSTNAVLPYLDTSGVPAVPGPSAFQPSPQQGALIATVKSPEKNVTSVQGRHQRLHCSNCGQYFLTRVSYDSHTCKHREYSCPVCSRKISTVRSLQRHMVQHQSSRKRFRCEVCCKTFLTGHYVKKHQETAHGFPVV